MRADTRAFLEPVTEVGPPHRRTPTRQRFVHPDAPCSDHGHRREKRISHDPKAYNFETSLSRAAGQIVHPIEHARVRSVAFTPPASIVTNRPTRRRIALGSLQECDRPVSLGAGSFARMVGSSLHNRA